MSGVWAWWVAAAALIGIELLVGTFYLLAVGVAVALGGVAALFGASEPMQFALAGVLGVALTIAVHRWRVAKAEPAPAPSLDVGQAVQVQRWNADGSARVSYRGSDWDAELAKPGSAHAETMYIVATRANVLLLSDQKPAP
jgi:membrane protein implicated in regulation of membrane protease activity